VSKPAKPNEEKKEGRKERKKTQKTHKKPANHCQQPSKSKSAASLSQALAHRAVYKRA
jgi:hypothetical protein